jgi:pimeloyl-ACP methyl ester carboxylesterase
MGDYDPLPYWRDMEVPALFLYGGRDANVDVSKSVNLIGESLKQEGPGYGLLLFRNNGHALYREDAMDFMARWILDGGVD